MKKSRYLTVEEVAALVCISVSEARKLVAELNDKLNEQGCLTLCGRVSRRKLEAEIYPDIVA